MRSLVALALLAMAGLSCDAGAEEVGTPIALRDPAFIVPGIVGNLRLMLFAADARMCQATGEVTPDVPRMMPDPAPEDAVVDVSFAATGSAMVSVPPGDYTILVRGWGTDRVTGVTNTIIASGCGTETIGEGETREIAIELHEIVGEGVCPDGILSPDEQCDDDNATAGDGCSPTCQTEQFASCMPVVNTTCGINTTTPNAQTLPQIAWLSGARAVVVYANETSLRFRYLSEAGLPIATPGFLLNDADPETVNGNEATPSVAIGGTRVGVAWAGFGGTMYDTGDIRVRFFTIADRMALDGGMSSYATTDRTGMQQRPAIALMSDGTAMVVFENNMSPTGLSGRTFASTSPTPEGGEAFAVGEPASLATDASIAALPSGFIVAFNAGGDVWFQRFGTDGSPMGMAAQVLGGPDPGAQSQPDVAAMPDGTAMVVWRDGTSIRGRIIGVDGVPAFEPFNVGTTPGEQSLPAVAADLNRFVVVWQQGMNDVRGRLFTGDGMPALNREPDPGTGDFAVATGAARAPDVAMGGLTPGAWMAVWEERGTDALGEISGRKFPLP